MRNDSPAECAAGEVLLRVIGARQETESRNGARVGTSNQEAGGTNNPPRKRTGTSNPHRRSKGVQTGCPCDAPASSVTLRSGNPCKRSRQNQRRIWKAVVQDGRWQTAKDALTVRAPGAGNCPMPGVRTASGVATPRTATQDKVTDHSVKD